MNGNKKNTGKRTERKRRPGGTGKGSAREKTEQGIAGQVEQGCRRTGKDDGESGGKVRIVSTSSVFSQRRLKIRWRFCGLHDKISVMNFSSILYTSNNLHQERKKKMKEKEYEFWKERRELEEMPYDMRFDVDGNSELCHATGYEVFDGEEWWNEFIDSNGEYQYGR